MNIIPELQITSKRFKESQENISWLSHIKIVQPDQLRLLISYHFVGVLYVLLY